jgi:hypothetical protein
MAVTSLSAAPPKSESRRYLDNKAWIGISKAPLSPKEIDRLVADEWAKAKMTPPARTTDEQFLRRVTLDLAGRLPTPSELHDFVTDTDPNKRTRWIDKLLDSQDYARRWASYWREVFASRVTDNLRRALAGTFEAWLAEQFRSNRPWDEIARDILTAQGAIYFPMLRPNDSNSSNVPESPAAFFLLSYSGDTAIYDRTNEAARIFLGIQIQCAQCHDHPYDGWQREQYHELAAYFGKVTERPIVERQSEGRIRIIGFRVVSRPFGDHRMPDLDDPKKTYPVSLRFLDGTPHPTRTTDESRRESLASRFTKENYYFAAAFVNRIWSELLGHGIVEPVDDLGPSKEGVTSPLLVRLAAGFRGSGFDVKALLRAICQSESYQRQSAAMTPTGPAAIALGPSPKRLDAESLWRSLTDVLGQITRFGMLGPNGPRANAMMMANAGGAAARFGTEGQFKQEFRFDPSLTADDIESTIPQVLWLMNHPEIQRRIRADATTMLGQLLRDFPRDGDAIRALYRRVLARQPTENEQAKALNYVRRANNRREAYEDLLWALLNSTEFQTKR